MTEKETIPANQTAPTLTLTPELDAVPSAPTPVEAISSQAAIPETEELDDSVLTQEELRLVDSFAEQIDVRDSATILQYGAGAQKKMADFSEKTLESVKTKDMGEVGDMVSGLVTQLKNFDLDENEKGIMGFFKKKGNQMQELKTKYILKKLSKLNT